MHWLKKNWKCKVQKFYFQFTTGWVKEVKILKVFKLPVEITLVIRRVSTQCIPFSILLFVTN